MNNSNKILGHRGLSVLAPRNSKRSFYLSYLNNFYGVELDLHITKNQPIVIIHDENTNGISFKNHNISIVTIHELKLLSFGKY